jgi:DNA-binding protein HU-beta
MYSQELVKRISDATHLSQKVISEVLVSERTVIKDTLKSGDKVAIPGFGVFYARARKAGKIKNGRTGKVVEYAARKVPAFRPGKQLKSALYKPKKG